MIEICEPPRGFGVAEVRGVAPGSVAEPGAAAGPGSRLRAALARHGVLCLRMGRKLTNTEFEAVAGLFGPIKEPVGRTVEGGTLRYAETRQVIDAGLVMTEALREKLGDLSLGGLDDQRPGLFETFHFDDSFSEEPARATVLHARALPPSGGGPTCFLDMRAAYRLLDDETRQKIDPLEVVYAYNNEDAFPPRRGARGEAEALVEVRHPLVWIHPVAGTRALHVDLDRAKHVAGMPIRQGRALLQRLQDDAEAHAPRCQHDWRSGDVLVWDNASVQHKAGGDFPVGEPRRFWRYLIGEARPS